MNLKRRIEDSPQLVRKIYREELISLYTTTPQITPFTLMFHEIKTSLYKARNTSYPPAPRTFDDINIEGVWSKTLNGEQFVFNNSKYSIFGTLESLKALPPPKSIFDTVGEISLKLSMNVGPIKVNFRDLFYLSKPQRSEVLYRSRSKMDPSPVQVFLYYTTR